MKNNRILSWLSEHRVIRVLVLIAFFYLICFFLFPFDSPLSKVTATDNGIYMTIGRSWIHGAIPYRDLFDQKGPFTFLVNAAGYLLSDSKTGPFLVCGMIVFSALAIEWHILSGISRRLALLTCFLTAAGVWVFAFCLNMPEVHVLPFTAYPVCTFYQWIVLQKGNIQEKLKPGKVFLFGICFGIALMTKATNGMVILGVCISAGVIYFRNRWYSDFWKSIAIFLAGTALIFGIFSVYFLIYGSFHDFIYGTFLFNFLYTGQQSKSADALRTAIQYAIPVLLPAGYLICDARKNGERNYSFVLLTVIFAIAGQSMGNLMPHYAACNLPLYALVIADVLLRLQPGRKRKAAITVYSFLILILFGKLIALDGWRVLTYSRWGEHIYQADIQVKDFIDAHHLGDSMLAYNTEPDIYLISETVPAWKHFSLQDFHAEFDPEIRDEFREILRSRKIQCLVLSSEPIADEESAALISENYELAYTATGKNYRGETRTEYIYVLR